MYQQHTANARVGVLHTDACRSDHWWKRPQTSAAATQKPGDGADYNSAFDVWTQAAYQMATSVVLDYVCIGLDWKFHRIDYFAHRITDMKRFLLFMSPLVLLGATRCAGCCGVCAGCARVLCCAAARFMGDVHGHTLDATANAHGVLTRTASPSSSCCSSARHTSKARACCWHTATSRRCSTASARRTTRDALCGPRGANRVCCLVVMVAVRAHSCECAHDGACGGAWSCLRPGRFDAVKF